MASCPTCAAVAVVHPSACTTEEGGPPDGGGQRGALGAGDVGVVEQLHRVRPLARREERLGLGLGAERGGHEGVLGEEGAAARQRGGEGREQQRAAVPADRERDRLATLTRTAQTRG